MQKSKQTHLPLARIRQVRLALAVYSVGKVETIGLRNTCIRTATGDCVTIADNVIVHRTPGN